MFTVAKNMSSEPLDNLTGTWAQASPEN